MKLRDFLLGIIGFVLIATAIVFALTPHPVHSQVASVTLTWTAPGDDAGVGTATSYEMRFSATAPDTLSSTTFGNWWNAATPVTNMPTPALAGTSQSVLVMPLGGFLTGRKYYFVMRATDDVGNISPFSNVAWRDLPDNIPPRAIIDLR